MNELTPEESEAIIEAAARGEVADIDALLGEMLVDLHDPAAEATHGAAPPLVTAGGDGLTGRIARRTAIAATVAVLSLAGVAAATTVGFELLDSGGGDAPTLIVDEAEDQVPPTIDDAAVSDSSTGAEDAPGASDSDVEVNGPDPIEGVDPADTLDDVDVEILCDAAANHGEFASSAAKDRTTNTDEAHGEGVSDAARSDCGGEDGPDVAPDPSETGTEAGNSDDDAGRGRGSGDDNAHDNSDGHGRDTAPGQNK